MVTRRASIQAIAAIALTEGLAATTGAEDFQGEDGGQGGATTAASEPAKPWRMRKSYRQIVNDDGGGAIGTGRRR